MVGTSVGCLVGGRGDITRITPPFPHISGTSLCTTYVQKIGSIHFFVRSLPQRVHLCLVVQNYKHCITNSQLLQGQCDDDVVQHVYTVIISLVLTIELYYKTPSITIAVVLLFFMFCFYSCAETHILTNIK